MYRLRHSGFGALMTPPASIQPAISNACANYPDVPCSLIQAVAQQESSYSPTAVSSAGAQGLMQIMPANDQSLNLSNPFDATANANAGAALLQQLYNQYGNWNLALVAYNEGSGNIAQYGINSGSQQYADTIMANAGLPNAPTMGPPPLDSTGDSSIGTSSNGTSGSTAGLFDLSSLTTDFSSLSFTDPTTGDLSTLAWVGIGVAVLAVVWAVA